MNSVNLLIVLNDAIDQFVAFLAIGLFRGRDGHAVALQLLTADFLLQADAIAVAAEHGAVRRRDGQPHSGDVIVKTCQPLIELRHIRIRIVDLIQIHVERLAAVSRLSAELVETLR